MYRYIYRLESQHTDAAVASLNPLITSTDEQGKLQVRQAEADPGEGNAFTRAPFLYALGLLIAEHALGLSGLEACVDTIFSHIGSAEVPD
jgi:hypothetical protein